MVVLEVVMVVILLAVAVVLAFGVRSLWFSRPSEKVCKKSDLPEDIREVLDEGVGGVLSNDQMVTLLRMSGSKEDAKAVAAEGTKAVVAEECRTFKDGDRLTDFELEFIKRGECPDCEHNEFLAGPRGGLAQNFKCAHCGSRFNDVTPFGVDRISDALPDRKLLS